ncbi:hypothetical protein ACPYPG_06805 [Streptomyces sp. FR-108]|uniref:hypothetical protein n=1 Tax=Streptomyces sp. FR-108 TaxID=3416665 RepID=UPI003CEA8ACE
MFGSIRKRRPVDGPFYKQRGWTNAAVFLGVAVAMSLATFLSGVTTGAPDHRTRIADESRDILSGLSGPLSPGDPQHVRGGTRDRPGNCRTEDGDTSRPTTTPADLRWRKLVAVMVPTSPSAGPLHRDSSVWWCFAHTPTGAVLAAHIIPVQLSGNTWRGAAEQQLVPGEPRDRFVTGKAVSGTTDPEEKSVGRFEGFSLKSYSARSATVGLLLSKPSGGHLSTSVTVRWQDGDWKVAPRRDGSLYSAVDQQAKPGDFAAWGDRHVLG